MNKPTNPHLEEALAKMRADEVFKNATPEQQALLEKIVRQGAGGGTDNAVAASFAVFIAPAIIAHYATTAPIAQDMLNGFFNAFKTAVIVETIMQLWPDPNTAPNNAVLLTEEAAGIYRNQVRIYNNIAAALMDDRIKRNAEKKA